MTHSKKCEKSADMHLIKSKDNLLSNQYSNTTYAGGEIIPPDPIIATGPESFIAMVNRTFGIYKKDTFEEIHVQGTQDFWDVSISGGDVWCVYDEFDERFVLSAHAVGLPTSGKSLILLAVSKTSTPQNGDDFYKYTYETANSADFPKMAVDKEAVYVTWNEFFPPPEFVTNTVVAFDKASMYDGSSPSELTPVYREDFLPSFSGGPFPGIFVSADVELLFPCQPRKGQVEKVILTRARVTDFSGDISLLFGDKITLYQIKDVLTSPVAVSVDVPVPRFTAQNFIIGPQEVPQPPPIINPPGKQIIGIESAQGVIFSGVVAGHSVWTNHVTVLDDGRNVPRWYEFDVSKFLDQNQASLVQVGNADPSGTNNGIWPSINVDKCGNMALNFTVVGPEQYPVLAYTGRLKRDPAGTIRLPVEKAIGGDLYYQIVRGGRNRYGDYSGLALDPCDHHTFWIFNQYPTAVDPGYEGETSFPATFGSNWTTFVGTFKMCKTKENRNTPQCFGLPEIVEPSAQALSTLKHPEISKEKMDEALKSFKGRTL